MVLIVTVMPCSVRLQIYLDLPKDIDWRHLIRSRLDASDRHSEFDDTPTLGPRAILSRTD